MESLTLGSVAVEPVVLIENSTSLIACNTDFDVQEAAESLLSDSYSMLDLSEVESLNDEVNITNEIMCLTWDLVKTISELLTGFGKLLSQNTYIVVACEVESSGDGGFLIVSVQFVLNA